MNFHNTIVDKLDYFIKNKKIPHLLFHGDYGSGKKYIVYNFLNKIYGSELFNDQTFKKNYIMQVNCAHGKGIKFVRDDIKFFAKTNIDSRNGKLFKTILLLNADQLTNDAQSALRRSIELFSNTTRYILIIQDKNKILRPILSRFCEIYVPNPVIDSQKINLYNYIFKKYENEKLIKTKTTNLYKLITQEKTKSSENIIEFTNKLYNKGYSILDIVKFIETRKNNYENKNEILIILNEIRKNYRSERMILFIACNLLLIRSSCKLDYVLFM